MAAIFLILAFQFAIVPVPGIGAGDAITYIHSERSMQPGEVILLEIRSYQPLQGLRIVAFKREFPAVSEDGGLHWTGLVGIDLETKPGRCVLEFNGVGKNGTRVNGGGTLTVTAKKFPERRLTVNEKYVTPPASALARIREESNRVNEIFSATTPRKIWQGPFRRPVPGQVISVFGTRSIYNGKPRSPHAGVDFRGSSGTPVRAPNSGIVSLASNLYYSGNTVILDHGLGLYSYFGHMSVSLVKEGDRVETGDIIGEIGATGVVTGPHLHWTVRLNTSRVDPLSLIHVLGGPPKQGQEK